MRTRRLAAWVVGLVGVVWFGCPPSALGVGEQRVAAELAARPGPRTPTLTDAQRPRRGRFLIASSQTVGPFFYRTVVLLLDHSAEGSVGVIINKPTALPLAQLLPEVEEVHDRDEPAYFGGPVEPNRVMLLIESTSPPADSLPIVGNIHASRSLEAFRAVASSSDADTRFRAYVGYAGWGPGQLEGELARGDWHVDASDADAIYTMPPEEVWPLFIRRNSGIQARAAGAAR